MELDRQCDYQHPSGSLGGNVNVTPTPGDGITVNGNPVQNPMSGTAGTVTNDVRQTLQWLGYPGSF